MAKARPNIPASVRRNLVAEAGGQCANPGCANSKVNVHHIQEWAVYQSHDAEHMIAICPSCHDSVHRGNLRLADDDLYRWKNSVAHSTPAHVPIDPTSEPTLRLGGIDFTGGRDGLCVFELSERNRLSFNLSGSEISHLNAKLSDANGTTLLEILDGYVLRRQPDMTVRVHPGRVTIDVHKSRVLLSGWAAAQLAAADISPEEGLLLDLQVVDPGVIEVRGVWMDERNGVVITKELLTLLRIGHAFPFRFTGRPGSGLRSSHGPVTALFRFPD